MHDGGMNSAPDLEQLSIEQLRQLLVQKDELLREDLPEGFFTTLTP